MTARTHRGWIIAFDPPPIPCRKFDWNAYDPNTDGETVCAGSLDDLIAEIDERIDERAAS